MRSIVRFPQNGLAATVIGITPKGEKVELERVEIEPFFFVATERPAVLFVEAEHESKTTDRAVVVLSGTNASLTLQHRNEPVKPAFAAKGKPKVKKEEGKQPESAGMVEPPEVVGTRSQ